MKIRIDKYLHDEGYFSSRTKATQAIEENRIIVNNQKIDKVSFLVDRGCIVEIIPKNEEFVSNGGYKLSKAIKQFNLSFLDKIILDIGASTGGFTDCALKTMQNLYMLLMLVKIN